MFYFKDSTYLVTRYGCCLGQQGADGGHTHLHTCTHVHTHIHIKTAQTTRSIVKSLKQTAVRVSHPSIWAAHCRQPGMQKQVHLKLYPEHRQKRGSQSLVGGGREGRHLACCPLKFSSPSSIWSWRPRKEQEAFKQLRQEGRGLWSIPWEMSFIWGSGETRDWLQTCKINNLCVRVASSHRNRKPC